LPLISLLSCSEDEPPAETRDGFCDRWADAACSAEVVSACQAADADACRLAQEEFCLDLVPANGFVDERADDCIDAVRAAYTDADLTADELSTVARLGEPCDRLVRGPRATGESCTSNLDCDGPTGAECVFKATSVNGTCQTPVSVDPGLDCSADDAVCTEGFYCNGDNCIVGGEVGDSCSRNEECAGGYCDGGTCVAGRAIDADCSADEQCSSGLCYAFSATERVCVDRVRLSRTDPLCEDLR
jgi:hypothetical protein